jgi:hypothetical protein
MKKQAHKSDLEMLLIDGTKPSGLMSPNDSPEN